MSKEISLFADYHTEENLLTNYCGLILKLLYEENPKSFEAVISALSSDDFNILPTFKQQIKKASSIPDLVIEQKSFSIFFETKTSDWFYSEQIYRHLEGFEKEKDVDYKILFLLSNFEIDNPEEKFQEEIKFAKETYGISLIPVSFEDFIETLEAADSSETYKKILNEFRAYLERNDYFPAWKHLFEVVNCASTIHEVYEHNVYMCPNAGGSYFHKRAKYFGGYKWKNVKYIHEVKAVVVIEQNFERENVKWNNSAVAAEDLIKEAKEKICLFNNRVEEIKKNGIQVFLLENPIEVNFNKESKGGLIGNKKYFYVKYCNATNSEELANVIKNKIVWN